MGRGTADASAHDNDSFIEEERFRCRDRRLPRSISNDARLDEPTMGEGFSSWSRYRMPAANATDAMLTGADWRSARFGRSYAGLFAGYGDFARRRYFGIASIRRRADGGMTFDLIAAELFERCR
jgi:hypothetical protein